MTKILDKGEVLLINRMGGDESVIAAARVSNGVSYEDALKGPEADQRLINYLVKHRHGTPFEHATFQFFVKAPLFVRSEWHRHRMASYNEISGRYVEYDPEFYTPSQFRVPAKFNKQGSTYPDTVSSEYVGVAEWNADNNLQFDIINNTAFTAYKELIRRNVAKEMARMILPASLYTQFYVTINARSLMNFLGLRAAEDAQWEIRQYALAMVDIFKEAMPMTAKAWEENDRIAP